MLRDSEDRLADHHAGKKLLTEKERMDLEKKVNIYKRKLETMQGDLDEREIERLLKKEQLRNERARERRAARGEL
jgi:Trp operon repressor